MKQEEFLQEYLKHRRMLFAFILSIVRRRDVAEDISQDVAMIAFKKLANFSAGTNFGAWIREIARRRILKERAQSGRLALGFDSEAIEAVALAHDRVDTSAGYWEEREAALLRCMDKLQDRGRRIVQLRYRDQAEFSSIAEVLGSTENSVQVTLSKIRASLRKCIQREIASSLQVN